MPRLSSILNKNSNSSGVNATSNNSGDQIWIEKFEKTVQPPVITAEDFLTRDITLLAKQCQCNIDELQVLKQRVAMDILSTAPSSSSGHQQPPQQQPQQQRLSLTKVISVAANSIIPSREEIAEYPHHYPSRPSGECTIDELFSGDGYPSGHMISLLGESRSGKTQVILHAAIGAAMEGQRVLFINSTNDISLIGMQTMVRQLLLQQLQLRISQQPGQGQQSTQESARLYRLQQDTQEQKHFIDDVLSRIHINPCFTLWQALDLLSSIQARHRLYQESMRRTEQLHSSSSHRSKTTTGTTSNYPGNDVDPPYDLIVIDCFHHWVAPYLHDSSATERVPFGASTISSTVGVTGGVGTGNASSAMVVNVHPFISELHLLMKSITVESHTTILVTNVLNKEHLQYHRQRSFGPQSRSLSTSASFSAHAASSSSTVASASINNSIITNKLSIATGTGGPSHYLDMYDIVLILSATTSLVSSLNPSAGDVNMSQSNNIQVSQDQGPLIQETKIELGVVVRPPYWKEKPKKAIIRLNAAV